MKDDNNLFFLIMLVIIGFVIITVVNMAWDSEQDGRLTALEEKDFGGLTHTELKCQEGFYVEYSSSKFLVCREYGTKMIYITAERDFLEEWFEGKK